MSLLQRFLKIIKNGFWNKPTLLPRRRESSAFWERSGGAGNTILKLFSNPDVRDRVARIKEILESKG
jgi:hypothetical protein